DLASLLVVDSLLSPFGGPTPRVLAATAPGRPVSGGDAAVGLFAPLTLTPANVGSTAEGRPALRAAPERNDLIRALWAGQVDAFFASSFADQPDEPAAWGM